MKFVSFFITVLICAACKRLANEVVAVVRDTSTATVHADTISSVPGPTPQQIPDPPPEAIHDIIQPVSAVAPHELVNFARTLIGVPYKYASTDPAIGFDCSGFITYVFNHFHINVPRSSVDFTNVGKEISRESAKEGDLILFTGTVDSIRIVGHMGIVTENVDTLKFIHSTSGRANGVTITPLTTHYQRRFVKVIRVFGT
jgi:cell wall-associated NlpC family hydrolase